MTLVSAQPSLGVGGTRELSVATWCFSNHYQNTTVHGRQDVEMTGGLCVV